MKSALKSFAEQKVLKMEFRILMPLKMYICEQ